MKQIPLYKKNDIRTGLFALVDDKNYEWLNKFHWLVQKRGNNLYHAFMIVGKSHIFMHQLILPTNDSNLEIDHKNCNGLDNQEDNLRLATRMQNARNRGLQANNTSGYKGVTWDAKQRSWKAALYIKGVRMHIGCYTNKEEAARAYNKVAFKHFGEFAKLNEFPAE